MRALVNPSRAFEILVTGSLRLGASTLMFACSCPADTTTGVIVRVMGGASGEGSGIGGAGGGPEGGNDQCLATVEVSDPKVTLTCNVDGPDCVCQGLNDQHGTFELTAELMGETETATVEIKKVDRCSVGTEYLCFFGSCPDDWP